MTSIHHLSKSVEWYTPPIYINKVRKVLTEIDLDPASNEIAQSWINANHYFTKKNNGLSQDWTKYKSIWLNPPYGQNLTSKWADKLIGTYDADPAISAICLVRPAVSASWFNKLAIRFLRCETFNRIRFIDENGVQQNRPGHGNVFFLLSCNSSIESRFILTFSRIGIISKPVSLS